MNTDKTDVQKELDRLRRAVRSLAANYHVRATYAPTPRAQWRDIERDLLEALGELKRGE